MKNLHSGTSSEFDAQSMISDWLAGDRSGTVKRYKALPDSKKFYFALNVYMSAQMGTDDIRDLVTMLETQEAMGLGGVRAAI